jgi:hypothetical protein
MLDALRIRRESRKLTSLYLQELTKVADAFIEGG